MDGQKGRTTEGLVDEQTDQSVCVCFCSARLTDRWTDRHSPRHHKHHPMCFSSKVMMKNVFSGYGGKHNLSVNGIHTDH